ncbi:hypothetical protein [Ensifer sp. 22564]|uniref:hypothetical protein n=1 Tax=Sinorhizobium/Ensifer group TaxID=227292 RepID=UPI003F874455
MTLLTLQEENHSIHADGYDYSRFCKTVLRIVTRRLPAMREAHAAGDRLFVGQEAASRR